MIATTDIASEWLAYVLVVMLIAFVACAVVVLVELYRNGGDDGRDN